MDLNDNIGLIVGINKKKVEGNIEWLRRSSSGSVKEDRTKELIKRYENGGYKSRRKDLI